MPTIRRFFESLRLVGSVSFVVALSLAVSAERKPDSPSDATVVVRGTVAKVFQRETDEQRQYMVQIRISNVDRGVDLKSGDLLTVYCFQRKPSPFPKPAESGHTAIPREGQEIRALAKPRNGNLEGIYPDWFTTESSEAAGPKIPDLVKEMKGTSFLKSEQVGEAETHSLTTDLAARDFIKELQSGLGKRWKKRVLRRKEMELAATTGRTSGKTVYMAVLEHPDAGREIRVLHLTPKDEKSRANVAITVMSAKESE